MTKKLILITSAALLMVGCATTAYKTLATLEYSVTTAFDSYSGQIIAGNVSTNALPSISRGFNQFQADFKVALDAVQYNTNALAPTSLEIEASDLLNAISTAKGTK